MGVVGEPARSAANALQTPPQALEVALLQLQRAVPAAAIGTFAPWRHPDTRYWRLMLPLYALLGLAAAWAVTAFGVGAEEAGLTGWSLLAFLSLLVPFASRGGCRWRGGGGIG